MERLRQRSQRDRFAIVASDVADDFHNVLLARDLLRTLLLNGPARDHDLGQRLYLLTQLLDSAALAPLHLHARARLPNCG